MNDGWKPIKDAPKDGTEVLGAYWSTLFGRWVHFIISWNGYWNEWTTGGGQPIQCITHFVPIPKHNEDGK